MFNTHINSFNSFNNASSTWNPTRGAVGGGKRRDAGNSPGQRCVLRRFDGIGDSGGCRGGYGGEKFQMADGGDAVLGDSGLYDCRILRGFGFDVQPVVAGGGGLSAFLAADRAGSDIAFRKYF